MLDIQKINHNYIIRMIIFSAFLYKSDIKNQDQYQKNVQEFISKKLPNIEVTISSISLSKDEFRDMTLDKILYDEESNISDFIVFKFKTSIKEVNLQIDLGNPDKYELFLYA
jgi:hypothetical protein